MIKKNRRRKEKLSNFRVLRGAQDFSFCFFSDVTQKHAQIKEDENVMISSEGVEVNHCVEASNQIKGFKISGYRKGCVLRAMRFYCVDECNFNAIHKYPLSHLASVDWFPVPVARKILEGKPTAKAV